ncbi:LuxR C-terminal-related transcriptional regulator [Achromobacter xylosoxidans]
MQNRESHARPHPDLPVILATLTPREREIVAYVAAGEPNKVIAIDLAISLRTVEAHRARIFAKLGCATPCSWRAACAPTRGRACPRWRAAARRARAGAGRAGGVGGAGANRRGLRGGGHADRCDHLRLFGESHKQRVLE